ncbi:hypothetical protein MSAN_00351200 [Mycena sanguinolenta]|uniref:DUF6534 domain-containing protein n=1 Tax=Mycena sanguinolenta TaxID=230812 RepID=A0A8H6Z986_9AGAR|nr:hypothetical protein MSAN_00351200 [Mycena sanguinolenta]
MKNFRQLQKKKTTTMATGAPPIVTYYIGGWFLGMCGDLILQGVIFAQFAHYITLYKKDIIWLRVYVSLLFVVTTLKSMQTIGTTWEVNVKYLADLESSFSYFGTAPLIEYNVLFVALIAFYVQMFFCQRLWAISKNIFILAVLILLFVFALIAALLAVVVSQPTVENIVRSPWIPVHLGTVFAGDFLLCGSMSFFLLTRSKQALPQTAGMLNAILKLTFQSAAPAAVCATVNLICNTVSTHSTAVASAWSLVATVANEILPKLYAISALWTLNSRRTIRLAGGSNSDGLSSSSEGRGAPSGGRSGRRMEMGVFSRRTAAPIQVRTEVQTTHHHDAQDLKFGRESTMDDINGDAESTRDVESTRKA